MNISKYTTKDNLKFELIQYVMTNILSTLLNLYIS